MTVYNVCLLCGGMHDYEGCGCPMAHARWKRPHLDFADAMSRTLGDGDLVIGDPTSFRSDQIDLGWDLESGGYYESRELREYDTAWQDRHVVHPKTGFVTKVGALPSDIQARFSPKVNAKVVDGGVVVNQVMGQQEFHKKIHAMGSQYDFHRKDTSSIYSLFKDLNGYTHAFWMVFDPEEIQSGATNIGRANKITYVGAFADFKYAKDYVMDMDQALGQRLNHKRSVIAQGTARYGQ